MSEQQKMDADLRQIVTEALVSMVSGVTGLVPPTGPGAIPDFIQAPIDRAVERISASLPVGVPDGFRVMKPTGAVLCDSDRWEIYAPCGSGGIVSEHDVKDWVVRNLLDALAAAPAAQPAAEQSEPGEVEEVEVRGLQWLDTGHYRKKPPQFGYNPHDWNPLMTVAQHERIVAALSSELATERARADAAVGDANDAERALSAQQSAHVSVPRELLRRVCREDGASNDMAMEELRALLNGGEA